KIIENFVKNFAQIDAVPIEDVVKFGGACIGDVERCIDSLQFLEDAGVDEVMLFMQLYTTPHDQIMRSIDLFANKVLPRIRTSSTRTQRSVGDSVGRASLPAIERAKANDGQSE